MTTTALSVSALRPLLEFCAGLDLSNPGEAKAQLEQNYPLDGDFIANLRSMMEQALEAGEICNKGQAPMTFSRLFKPTEESCFFSGDAVDMYGPGPRHAHPEGEIDLCFTLNGDAEFDGNPEGWTVYGTESIHTPTVSEGRMLILYLLPNGAFKLINDNDA